MQILKIFVPIMLPTASSNSPFLAAPAVMTSSGNEVPITITVIEMIFSLMPIFSAKAAALSTVRSLAIAMTIIVMIMYIVERNRLYLAFGGRPRGFGLFLMYAMTI